MIKKVGFDNNTRIFIINKQIDKRVYGMISILSEAYFLFFSILHYSIILETINFCSLLFKSIILII